MIVRHGLASIETVVLEHVHSRRTKRPHRSSREPVDVSIDIPDEMFRQIKDARIMVNWNDQQRSRLMLGGIHERCELFITMDKMQPFDSFRFRQNGQGSRVGMGRVMRPTISSVRTTTD